MLNTYTSSPNRLKKFSKTYGQYSTSNSRIWTKKNLHIDVDHKELRETDATLSSTPKNKKPILPTDFAFLRFLGNGKFGSVYLTRHIETGFIFAMKVINKSHIQAETPQQSAKLLNQLIREIKIQMFMNHPNLIKLYSFFCDEYKVYLLMELACDGQLYEYMRDGHRFTEESTSFLMRQILLGVNYMHEHHVIHRDVKPENIVLVHGMPKLCDFGWSVYCSKEFRSTLCGTPLYLSPQILKGDFYNEKIDTWAIGTLTYQMLTGENPFKITKKSEMTKIITQKFIMKSGSTSTKDFFQSALQKEPTKRMTAKMMLEHPFIFKYKEIQTCEQICKMISLRQKARLKQKSKIK